MLEKLFKRKLLKILDENCENLFAFHFVYVYKLESKYLKWKF